MTYAFHVRSDAIAKPGGDYNLTLALRGMLVEEGWTVEIVTGAGDLPRNCDGVLVFNLDRPHEPFAAAKAAKDRGIAFSLYPLHHPHSGIAEYLRRGTVGYRKLLALAAGAQPLRYESLLMSAKNLVAGKWAFGVDIITEQRFLLEQSSRIFLAAPTEYSSMRNDLSIGIDEGKCVHLPYAFTAMSNTGRTGGAVEGKRDKLVICGGRIETRKNQTLVLELAKHRTDYEFLFIGRANPTEKSYFANFREKAKGLRNVVCRDSMDLESFREQLARAEVFISASWFEVVSLSELEALNAGCKILVTSNSYISDFLDSDDCFFQAGNSGSLERAFDAIAGKASKTVLKNIPSRKMVKDELLRSLTSI